MDETSKRMTMSPPRFSSILVDAGVESERMAERINSCVRFAAMTPATDGSVSNTGALLSGAVTACEVRGATVPWQEDARSATADRWSLP